MTPIYKIDRNRCGQWDGQQCRATKTLVACALKVEQGTILKGPEKVIVYLCPKHFQLALPPRSKRKWEKIAGEGHGKG